MNLLNVRRPGILNFRPGFLSAGIFHVVGGCGAAALPGFDFLGHGSGGAGAFLNRFLSFCHNVMSSQILYA